MGRTLETLPTLANLYVNTGKERGSQRFENRYLPWKPVPLLISGIIFWQTTSCYKFVKAKSVFFNFCVKYQYEKYVSVMGNIWMSECDSLSICSVQSKIYDFENNLLYFLNFIKMKGMNVIISSAEWTVSRFFTSYIFLFHSDFLSYIAGIFVGIIWSPPLLPLLLFLFFSLFTNSR